MFQRRGHWLAPIGFEAVRSRCRRTAGMQGVDAFIDDLLVRDVARPDRDIGVLIDRFALLDQAPDGRGGIGGLQQRAVGAALDAPQDGVGVGLEPDRNRLGADAVAGFLAHEGAAAGGEHAGTAVEQPRDHARLAVAEMRLAMGLEDIRVSTCRPPPRFRYRRRETAAAAGPTAAARWWTCRRPSCPPARSNAFPAPRMISASWDTLVPGDEAVSDICSLIAAIGGVPRHLYYPRRYPLPENSCNGGGEHVGSQAWPFPTISWLIRRLRLAACPVCSAF